MSRKETTSEPRRDGLRLDAAAVAVYLLATLLTDANFMGDTPGYVAAIRAYAHGGAFIWDNPFWEFGHLLWRPVAYEAARLLRPATSIFAGSDERLQTTLALMWINWLAGLACVLLVRRLASRASRRARIVLVTTACFALTNAFLDYAQTGCAYVPGLALLLLALHLILRATDDEGARRAATNSTLAGASLACAVCLWFPYLLAVPAALAAPLCMGRSTRARALRATLRATAACAVCGALAYGAVVAHLGIHDAAGLKSWIASAGHGYNRTGLLRMLFGLARSFVNMGQDGMLFKRYMLHDPYSPVSLSQIARASLWQLALFYLVFALACWRLLRSREGRRALVLLAVACAPVFAFALFVFEGGMPERYLPLFPFAFVALALALDDCAKTKTGVLNYVVAAFAFALVFGDARAMSKPALAARQASVVARLGDLPARIRPHSVVATVHLQDELSDFYFNYPFNPVNRGDRMEVYNVLEPGAARIATWREDFARKVQTAWGEGGEVWLSRRFFAAQPRPEWNWVEGDERRVTWRDLPEFFSNFDTSDQIGGEDGFALLARTPRNEELIARTAGGAESQGGPESPRR